MWNRLNDEPSMMKSVTEKSAEKQIATTDGSEQYSLEQVRGVTNVTAGTNTIHEESMGLLSAVLDRPNMWRAYERVLRNKGAAGVDGMKVSELKAYLQDQWSSHKEALLKGAYHPSQY